MEKIINQIQLSVPDGQVSSSTRKFTSKQHLTVHDDKADYPSSDVH